MFELREVVEPRALTEMRKKDPTLFERRKCVTEDHVVIKQNRELWIEKTIPRGLHAEWDVYQEPIAYLEVACCTDCGSLIAWHKPLSHEEVQNGVILPT